MFSYNIKNAFTFTCKFSSLLNLLLRVLKNEVVEMSYKVKMKKINALGHCKQEQGSKNQGNSLLDFFNRFVLPNIVEL